MIVIVMGVTGSGKTTIGQALAQKTGAEFADADDFHPAANKTKMAAGHPLDDADRQPWLEALNAKLLAWFVAETSGILACSALKAIYRATLQQGIPGGNVHFVLLDASRQLIVDRLQQRHHEFMNPALLESQIQTLEVPADALRVCNDRTPSLVVDEILAKLQQ